MPVQMRTDLSVSEILNMSEMYNLQKMSWDIMQTIQLLLLINIDLYKQC